MPIQNFLLRFLQECNLPNPGGTASVKHCSSTLPAWLISAMLYGGGLECGNCICEEASLPLFLSFLYIISVSLFDFLNFFPIWKLLPLIISKIETTTKVSRRRWSNDSTPSAKHLKIFTCTRACLLGWQHKHSPLNQSSAGKGNVLPAQWFSQEPFISTWWRVDFSGRPGL